MHIVASVSTGCRAQFLSDVITSQWHKIGNGMKSNVVTKTGGTAERLGSLNDVICSSLSFWRYEIVTSQVPKIVEALS